MSSLLSSWSVSAFATNGPGGGSVGGGGSAINHGNSNGNNRNNKNKNGNDGSSTSEERHHKKVVIDRRSIAGLWSLKPRINPMKEFTVYPKRPQPEDPEFFLVLKEDGSFQRYNGGSAMFDDEDDDNNDKDEDINVMWSKFQQMQKKKEQQELQESLFLNPLLKQTNLVKGQWDYVDGKLLLAADRPEQQKKQQGNQPRHQQQQQQQQQQQPIVRTASSSSSSPTTNSSSKKKRPISSSDTLLVGRVVINPMRRSSISRNRPQQTTATSSSSSSTQQSSSLNAAQDQQVQQGQDDTQKHQQQPPSDPKMTTSKIGSPSKGGGANSGDLSLTVPSGSVKVGKFMYPKHHPSFFEQPMFQPTKQGSFTLRQVLGGSSNKDNEDDDDNVIEKFHRDDFYNKTFLLTSRPLRQVIPKGRQRWSIKHNKYVYDPPSKEAAKAAKDDEQRSLNIRVMQIQFFANNTFETIAGLGDNVKLRGKFDIIGREYDQLWMRIYRFGFGRSVSGSVYSEGKMLSHEDAKSYWGTISYEQQAQNEKKKKKENDDDVDGDASTSTGTNAHQQLEQEEEPNPPQKKLEVNGSVLFGSGLEPMPVGRFIMRELIEEFNLNDIDDDDIDDDDIDDDDDTASLFGGGAGGGSDDILGSGSGGSQQEDGVDWANAKNDQNAFQ